MMLMSLASFYAGVFSGRVHACIFGWWIVENRVVIVGFAGGLLPVT